MVMLPDNDEPAGCTRTMAGNCHAAGLKVKIVTLPDLQPKGDVCDWLDAGHTREELVALVKATALYTPTAAVEVPAADVAGPVLVTLANVQPETVSYLVAGPHRARQVKSDCWRPRSRQVPTHARLRRAGLAWRSRLAGWRPRAARRRDSPVTTKDALTTRFARASTRSAPNNRRVHALTAIRNGKGDQRGFCLAYGVALLERVIGASKERCLSSSIQSRPTWARPTPTKMAKCAACSPRSRPSRNGRPSQSKA